HALVMGHESADYRDVFTFRQTTAGVIERLVESVASRGARTPAPSKILHGSRWIDHRCERRRIRRDYQVFTQPALQPQAGNSETRVLISEIHVARVERRF